MVEHHRRRQAQTRERLQSLTQLEADERVEAQLEEGEIHLEAVRGLVAESTGDLGAGLVDDRPPTVVVAGARSASRARVGSMGGALARADADEPRHEPRRGTRGELRL